MNETFHSQLEKLEGKINDAVQKIANLNQENQRLQEENKKLLEQNEQLNNIEQEWNQRILDLIQKFENVEDHPTHDSNPYESYDSSEKHSDY